VVPAYRVDVTREIDVIEEILRVYGYNNISFTQKLNASISNSARNEDYKLQNIIGAQMVSLGFNEMMANSLTTPDYIKLSENLKEEFNVMMLNPLSSDLSAMRQSLLFSALEAVSFNINRKRGDLKLFEFGKTYHKMPSGYEEKKHLTLTVTGSRLAESWSYAQKPVDFFMFKGYINLILTRLGIAKVQTQPVTNDVFSEGIALAVGTETIVEFGTIKKSVLKHFDIKQDVFFADFNWGAIIKMVTGKIKYTEISKFPEVRRDLALLVDHAVSFESIYTVAKQTEKSLLKDVSLFDVYEGNNLPEGKKSYAVSFMLQDSSKTLTDEQIDKIMGKIRQNLEKETGAQLR
jgi:phenylalanyl-tRNA synthetase beta chain